MINPQGLHIGAPAAMLGNSVCVSGKQFHESGGAARFTAGALDGIAGRPEDGQVVAATAAVLVGFGLINESLVNVLDRIVPNGHHIAVIESGLDILTAGTVHDAAAGDEAEILQDPQEPFFPYLPQLGSRLDPSHGAGLPDPQLPGRDLVGRQVLVAQNVFGDFVIVIVVIQGVAGRNLLLRRLTGQVGPGHIGGAISRSGLLPRRLYQIVLFKKGKIILDRICHTANSSTTPGPPRNGGHLD